MRNYVVDRNYNFTNRKRLSRDKFYGRMDKYIYIMMGIIFCLLAGQYEYTQHVKAQHERAEVVVKIINKMDEAGMSTGEEGEGVVFASVLMRSEWTTEQLKGLLDPEPQIKVIPMGMELG